MYEKIKDQFESGKSLSKRKYYSLVDRRQWPKYNRSFYPIAREYYHPLNPMFLHTAYRDEILKFTNVITVRDGYMSLAAWILNNFQKILEFDLHFLIHPDHAPLVPPNLVKNFSTWKITQPVQIKIEAAKRIILFGLANHQYLGDTNQLISRLQFLKKTDPEAEINVYLTLKKDPFMMEPKENVVCQKVVSEIKELIGKRTIKYITGDDFFAISEFQNTYLFDMGKDTFLVGDNYLHYYVASRGGSVNKFSNKKPKDSFFEIDLSFHHQLHACPLPRVPSLFVELLLHKKKSPATLQLEFDANIQTLLKSRLASD